MDKKALIIIGAILVVGLGLGIWLYNSVQTTAIDGNMPAEPVGEVTLPEGIIIFYGKECPHCQKVEEFIDQNGIKDKVEFSMLEVWHDEVNRNTMLQAAKNCNLLVKEVGVPLLYDGQDCHIGEVDVINFLKEKAGI